MHFSGQKVRSLLLVFRQPRLNLDQRDCIEPCVESYVYTLSHTTRTKYSQYVVQRSFSLGVGVLTKTMGVLERVRAFRKSPESAVRIWTKSGVTGAMFVRWR